MGASRDDLSDHVKPAFDKYVAEYGEPGALQHDSSTVVVWDKGKDDKPHKIYDLKTGQEITLQEAINRGAGVSRAKAMKVFIGR